MTSLPKQKNSGAGENGSKNNNSGATKYEGFELGILYDLIFCLSKNAKTSILFSVGLGILMNSSDTASDIWIFTILLNRNFIALAIVLFGIDFIPGIIVSLHQATSSQWKYFTTKEKLFSTAMLTVQPFSLVLTNFAWLSNISNDHRHFMARLSTVIHGCLESPMQFVMLGYLWSKGYLKTPWEEYSVWMDRNNNAIPVGNVAGTFSLTVTVIGILKGTLDIFEAHDEKYRFFVFTIINTTFRVLSFTYCIQIFDTYFYVLPFLGVLIFINGVLYLCRSDYHGKMIGTISSVICSPFSDRIKSGILIFISPFILISEFKISIIKAI